MKACQKKWDLSVLNKKNYEKFFKVFLEFHTLLAWKNCVYKDQESAYKELLLSM